MKMLIGLEYNNIERLENVGSMWGEAKGNDSMIVAKIKELFGAMRTISIKQKQAILALLSLC